MLEREGLGQVQSNITNYVQCEKMVSTRQGQCKVRCRMSVGVASSSIAPPKVWLIKRDVDKVRLLPNIDLVLAVESPVKPMCIDGSFSRSTFIDKSVRVEIEPGFTVVMSLRTYDKGGGQLAVGSWQLALRLSRSR
jgi:hypothetical protein